MKKAVSIIVVICVLIIISILVAIPIYKRYKENKDIEDFERTLQEAEVLNEKSFMGEGIEYLKFAGLSEDKLTDFSPERPKYEGTYDGYVNGYFYKTQKSAKDFRLLQVIISGGNYHVFGMGVGDNLEEAIETLKERGYKEREQEQNINNDGMLRWGFQKDLVVIVLVTSENSKIIEELYIITDCEVY